MNIDYGDDDSITKEVATITKEVATITKEVTTITKEVATKKVSNVANFFPIFERG